MKRKANQHSGGNLLTQREADRLRSWIRTLEKMIVRRDFYVPIDRELADARAAFLRALDISDR